MASDSMIRFYCVGCGRRNKAPRDYAGKNSRCPACKTINRIPEAAGASTPTPQFRARKTLSTPITPEGIVDAGASIIADVGDFMDQPASKPQPDLPRFDDEVTDREAAQRRQKYETLVVQDEQQPPVAKPPTARRRTSAGQRRQQPAQSTQQQPDSQQERSDIQFDEPQKKVTMDLVIAMIGAVALGALVTWFIISMTSG